MGGRGGRRERKGREGREGEGKGGERDKCCPPQPPKAGDATDVNVKVRCHSKLITSRFTITQIASKGTSI